MEHWNVNCCFNGALPRIAFSFLLVLPLLLRLLNAFTLLLVAPTGLSSQSGLLNLLCYDVAAVQAAGCVQPVPAK